MAAENTRTQGKHFQYYSTGYRQLLKIKNNLYRQHLYPTHTRTYHNMLNPNQRKMYDGKFVWLNYRSI